MSVSGHKLTHIAARARQGAGLVSVLENMVNEHIKVGRLVRVLEDWCPPLSGFFLYYPAQRHTPAALRAFVDEDPQRRT